MTGDKFELASYKTDSSVHSDFPEEHICMIFKFTAREILNNNQAINLEEGVLDCRIIGAENSENYNRG